jgi:hypothetical protein
LTDRPPMLISPEALVNDVFEVIDERSQC